MLQLELLISVLLLQILSFQTTVPANSSSNGVAGTIARDTDYLYVCVSNNTWKRATLNTW
jgi:hypothetical protein